MPYAVPDSDDQGPARSLTVAAASKLLDCDPSQVRKMLRRGDLDGYRLGKRGVRVLAESITAYQRRHSLVPTATPEKKPRGASPSRRAAAARLRELGYL